MSIIKTEGIDHVGLAVRQLETTLEFFTAQLGFEKVGAHFMCIEPGGIQNEFITYH